jgi:GNAT superfamily N-acetyltransferase
MTERELTVVDYERDKHEAGLLDFLRARYDGTTVATRKKVLDWIHEELPERERQPLRHVIVDGDKVAGSMGYLPVDFLVGGKKVAARFTHDLLVDPSYRGRGLAKSLVRRQLDLGGFMPGGMWMTGPCHKLHLACGFVDMPPLVPQNLVLDVNAFLAKREAALPKRIAQRIVFTRLRSRALKAARRELDRAGNSYKVRDVDVFAPELDAKWLELLKSYQAGRIRDAAHLNWKYMKHPYLEYRGVLLEKDEAALGYMVWRLPAPGSADGRSVVVDFLVGRGDERAFRLLMSRVIEDSSREGVEMISILSTQPWVVDCLRRLGFLPRRASSTWVVAGWEDVIDAVQLKDLGAWHICIGDSDGDMWTGSQ